MSCLLEPNPFWLPVLRSFSCPNLMHEFEFEIRISDQIQTVKMAVGTFEILAADQAAVLLAVKTLRQRGLVTCFSTVPSSTWDLRTLGSRPAPGGRSGMQGDARHGILKPGQEYSSTYYG